MTHQIDWLEFFNFLIVIIAAVVAVAIIWIEIIPIQIGELGRIDYFFVVGVDPIEVVALEQIQLYWTKIIKHFVNSK